MNKEQIPYPQVDRWSYLWLLIGTVLGILSISIGKWIIPIAAWLGPIFILRFMRTQRRVWLGYLILAVTTALATAIALPDFLGPLRPAIIIGAGILIPLKSYLKEWLGATAGLVGIDLIIYALIIMVVSAFEPRGIWGIIAKARRRKRK